MAALVVWLRTLRLLFSGHRAVALENMALRQQLSVLRRTVRRPHLRTSDRLFWLLLARCLGDDGARMASGSGSWGWPAGPAG